MDKKDNEFLVCIINKIAKYAKEQGYGIDETIKSVAEWLDALISISTFEDYVGDWEDGEYRDSN